MKIFKSVTLTEVSEVGAQVGETIVCPTKENPNDYQVYVHRIQGIYTPTGKFTDLATAIKYAERLENPSMVKQGYQIIELDHKQKLIIYYNQLNNEVLDYIHNSEQISDAVIELEESGISVRFIIPKENELEQINRLDRRDEMVEFGNYLNSPERRELFKSHTFVDSRNLEEALKKVYHSDYDHFKVWRKDKEDSEVSCSCPPIDREAEMRVMGKMKLICEQSLSPKGFEKFESVVDELVKNRKGLKVN